MERLAAAAILRLLALHLISSYVKLGTQIFMSKRCYNLQFETLLHSDFLFLLFFLVESLL